MRIAEIADRVGVPTSTVRYYERIGLLPSPQRTESGYRDYDEEAALRLLFICRARNMGVSCQQITELLPVWDGTNCTAAQERIERLIADKQAEIADRIRELERFSAQLENVRATLESAPSPSTCRADLSCCLPASKIEGPIHVALIPSKAAP